ncbi:MAG TPA: ABC transporter permease [Jatrophihabitans sp.]|jgi:peptide/nickel transport system permease protein|uniref:ABC transporter permease n=1 Tax=Jatrophihabitans sp. TaxID=1932789 RepID=UPI002E0CFC8C|nr:ABC transporter permease [Jatrophihabitans sp.]
MSVPLSDLEADVASVNEVDEPKKGAIAGRSPTQLAMARLRHDKVSMVAFAVIVISILMAIASPILENMGILDPYTPHYDLVGGLGTLPNGPFGGIGWHHMLGVEPGIGRDVLSRVFLGVTFSLMISTAATIISVVFGMVFGIISGYAGGATDFWISRWMDLILAFPQLLMLLALSPVLKDRITSMGVPAGTATSAVYLIVVLGFFGWPYLARIVRGQVLTLRNREFVEAARSLGATRRRIWFRELLPNLWAPLLVYVSLTLPLFISAEAALSFLGVGLQAPTPSLGNILNDSVSYFDPDPTFFFVPGIVLVLIVLAFNMLGDGLRDALDPKSSR